MWPFKKKEAKKEVDHLGEIYKKEQEECFSLYPTGKEFDYMGVTLKVTANVGYIKGLHSPYFIMPTTYPCIKCDYVNAAGEIKNKEFSCQEVNQWSEAT